MRVNRILAGLAAVPLLLGAAPAPLEPSSKWAVDYGAQRCTLARRFGLGASSVILRFEQAAPFHTISVMIAGKPLPPGNGRRDNVLEFQPLGTAFIRDGMSVVTTKGEQEAVYWGSGLTRGKWGLLSDAEALRLARAMPPGQNAGRDIPGFEQPTIKWEDRNWSTDDAVTRDHQDKAFDERASHVTAVALNPGKRGSVTLRTGSLQAPLRALEKCTDDSLKDWGVDAAVEGTIAQPARPIDDTSKLMTSADYPKRAISANKESKLEVWLNIDPAGSISSCRVISTFASPEINDQMCKLVQQRQRFIPAKTANGTAVPSYYVESFFFQLAD